LQKLLEMRKKIVEKKQKSDVQGEATFVDIEVD
jgi:hypothetical protein